jgi:hypothetical protein
MRRNSWAPSFPSTGPETLGFPDEYAGPRPVYGFRLRQEGMHLYVDALTGEVRARRRGIWHIYDFAFQLHSLEFPSDAARRALMMGVVPLAMAVKRLGGPSDESCEVPNRHPTGDHHVPSILDSPGPGWACGVCPTPRRAEAAQARSRGPECPGSAHPAREPDSRGFAPGPHPAGQCILGTGGRASLAGCLCGNPIGLHLFDAPGGAFAQARQVPQVRDEAGPGKEDLATQKRSSDEGHAHGWRT